MPDVRRALLNAMRVDAAYMEPTWTGGDAQIFVEVSTGLQYVAIAGTNSLLDAWRDILLTFQHREICGEVRDGFADSWDPLRDASLEELGIDRNIPTALACHSLGVPVGQYQALEFRKRGVNVVYVEGFGGPSGFAGDAPKYREACIPTTIWKNGFDIVAGRPRSSGCCPGDHVQIHNGKILPKVYHPSLSFLHPFQMAANHRLQGPRGYVETLGRANGYGWRAWPEAVRWREQVARWEARK